MQWSRVKTILILILLLVNGFLAAMLGGKALFAYRRAYEMRQHVEVVLKKKGITLAASVKIPRGVLMPQLRADRSRGSEAEMAKSFLGADAVRREEGQEIYFQSAAGEVIWNEQGEVRARLIPEGYTMPGSAQISAAATQILQQAGINTTDMSLQIEGSTAVLCARLAGYEVFNQKLTVTFAKNEITIAGRWIFDLPYSTKSDFYAGYHAADALILFAQQGPSCEIEDIKPGLLLTNASTNYSQITPAWQISTKRGVFFVDPLKKDVL